MSSSNCCFLTCCIDRSNHHTVHPKYHTVLSITPQSNWSWGKQKKTSALVDLTVYTPPLSLGFPSHLRHHRALSRLPCAMQLVLVVPACSVSESCLTLCNPKNCSTPASSIHGIFQARVLEWVAISFFRDLPNPGIEPRSPALQADALPSKPPGKS